MKRRPPRDIEIFSLSAIDLFAAAMSAFALLTIVLMPYYQKELKERTPENNIADQARAAELSKEETEIRRKALEEQVQAATAALSEIKSDAQNKLAEFIAAEEALEEKQAAYERAIEQPEPEKEEPAPEEKPSLVSFRFLGMKTTKRRILVALDMNRCMGGHEPIVQDALKRIIDSLQKEHELAVVGFQQTNAGFRMRNWPSSGLRAVDAGAQREAIQFANSLTSGFSGSSPMLSAFDQMLSGPADAIFLVSDGWPNPRFNNNIPPNRLAQAITQRNTQGKEIHTVVVGSYFDYPGAVDFMSTLAEQNGGEFMALASSRGGVCD